MLSPSWFLYLEEQSIGPLDEKAMALLIKHNRIHGNDYVWTDGLSQWVRAIDSPALSHFFPALPKISPPVNAKIPVLETRKVAAPKLEVFVEFEKDKKYPLIQLSETGLLFEGIDIHSVTGKEVSFKLSSPHLREAFDLTGILVCEDYEKTKNLIAVEFTRLNPQYRKQIQSLVHVIATAA